ncbi:MAG: leucyl/phenylalanyl-tRNA--protein transferase [Devosiaceae bacterium]|nr:leucyl/phenylalanyl-tRNA--protein transferase [Devosiaceae bacterium]
MTHSPDPFELELTADLVVRAYQAGIFPMSESEEDPDVFWVCPEQRGIIPLDGFKTSRTLRKALNKHTYSIRTDTDFLATIDGCAHAGSERESTWISPTIVAVYAELFEKNICHTVEVWEGTELVGGLYGLSLGGVFFGESMFHRRPNTSKIALAHLVDRLNAGGYSLLDTQFISDHLQTLGGIEIPRAEYEKRLHSALHKNGNFNAIDS